MAIEGLLFDRFWNEYFKSLIPTPSYTEDNIMPILQMARLRHWPEFTCGGRMDCWMDA